jgi:hypothetical protein
VECTLRLRKGLAGRSWCSPIRLQRPARKKRKTPPRAKPTTARAFLDNIAPVNHQHG